MGKKRVVASKVDMDAVGRITRLDLAHAAFEHQLSLVNQRDGVAELLHLVHAVGAEQDRPALFAQVDQRIHQQRRVDRVESAEWLVHDDQFGLMQQRGDELDLLLHSLRELFGLLVDRIENLHALAPDMRALGRGDGVKPVQLPQKDELVKHLHLLVEAALFRQITDPVQGIARKRLAEELHGAGVGLGDADHHADGRGLTRAVGPKQPEHGSGLDGKGQALDGDLGVVGFADAVEFDDSHRFLI